MSLKYVGALFGSLFGLGIVVGLDHAFHSDHALGFLSSFLLGSGSTGIGGLIGLAAER